MTMKDRTYVSLTLVGLVVFFILVKGILTEPQAGKSGLKIGVVNILQVFRNYLRVNDIQSAVNREKDLMNADIDEMQGKLKKLVEEIKELPKDSELAKEKMLESVSLEAQVKFKTDYWNKLVAEKMNKLTAELFNEISDSISEYAEAHGYDLILKTTTRKIEKLDGDANDLIDKRIVLYHDKSMDLTQDIINLLNKKYLREKEKEKQKGKGSGSKK